jgi:hypothetical protein
MVASRRAHGRAALDYAEWARGSDAREDETGDVWTSGVR